MQRIYLDHNATTPVHPAAREAMLPLLGETFGNPSSVHWFGQQARRALDRARQQVAAAIGAAPDEIVFTSGGTEADNLGVLGAAKALGPSSRILVSPVEHQAVRSACQTAAALGHEVVECPVDGHGVVDTEALLAAVRPGTLVTVMLASNDLGTIQPLADLAPRIHERGGLLHTDAVQALGKVPVQVGSLGADLLSLSAHKLGGPKGAGALYVKRGTSLAPLAHGGHQERRLRAGTENIAGIAGFGAACASAVPERLAAAPSIRALRDRLQAAILSEFPDVMLHGHPEARLPNTLLVSFGGLSGETLVMALDVAGVAASTGAACSSGLGEPSYVLAALGVPIERHRSTLRLSLGPSTTAEEIERVSGLLPGIVAQIRQGDLGLD
ncbi:MAG: cysteine desulfurase family protein [Polyangia bacterium]|jgi:cysteine desulfurase|nr:cysteine desulfurase family protein [Polyangia bacterium]